MSNNTTISSPPSPPPRSSSSPISSTFSSSSSSSSFPNSQRDSPSPPTPGDAARLGKAKKRWGRVGRVKAPIGPTGPIAVTQYGLVEGRRLQLRDGTPYNIFLGIRFAKPPLGDLRFRRPQPPDHWWGDTTAEDANSNSTQRPLPAKRYGPRAIQRDFWWDRMELRVGTSEDCLFLNVITPGDSLPPQSSPCSEQHSQQSEHHHHRSCRPVMVYIHGGGYVMDSAVKYHYRRLASTLVRHGVLVVTLQYRLGYLGYWSTGDGNCPGNAGLWDQLAALRWVRDNIAGFGGDPENITLFGQSAGAASADLLALSPHSRHLFEKLILMGGTAEAPWAVGRRDEVVEFCRAKALRLGFKRRTEKEGLKEGNKNGVRNGKKNLKGASDNAGLAEWSYEENRAMMAFVRRVPARKFAMTMLGDRTVIREMRIPLTPVIDGELLPKSLKELRAESPVRRVIAGVGEHEGLLFLAIGLQRVSRRFLSYCEHRAMSMLMSEGPPGVAANEKSAAATIIALDKRLDEFRGYYAIDETTRKSRARVAEKCVEIMSDLISNLPLHNFCCEMTQNGSTVYRYSFEHHNPNITRPLNPLLPYTAATHCTELAYLFNLNVCLTPWRRNRRDREIRALVTRLWTNFAKSGNPNTAAQQNDTHYQYGDNNGKKQSIIAANIAATEDELWKPFVASATEQQQPIRSHYLAIGTSKATAHVGHHHHQNQTMWKKKQRGSESLQGSTAAATAAMRGGGGGGEEIIVVDNNNNGGDDYHTLDSLRREAGAKVAWREKNLAPRLREFLQ